MGFSQLVCQRVEVYEKKFSKTRGLLQKHDSNTKPLLASLDRNKEKIKSTVPFLLYLHMELILLASTCLHIGIHNG